MTEHKITCEQDIKDLQEQYEFNSNFECVESGEEFCLCDLLCCYDGQELVIKKIN
jgi:hypothetical protein